MQRESLFGSPGPLAPQLMLALSRWERCRGKNFTGAGKQLSKANQETYNWLGWTCHARHADIKGIVRDPPYLESWLPLQIACCFCYKHLLPCRRFLFVNCVIYCKLTLRLRLDVASSADHEPVTEGEVGLDTSRLHSFCSNRIHCRIDIIALRLVHA
jgi:hypothetical protein